MSGDSDAVTIVLKTRSLVTKLAEKVGRTTIKGRKAAIRMESPDLYADAELAGGYAFGLDVDDDIEW